MKVEPKKDHLSPSNGPERTCTSRTRAVAYHRRLNFTVTNWGKCYPEHIIFLVLSGRCNVKNRTARCYHAAVRGFRVKKKTCEYIDGSRSILTRCGKTLAAISITMSVWYIPHSLDTTASSSFRAGQVPKHDALRLGNGRDGAVSAQQLVRCNLHWMSFRVQQLPLPETPCPKPRPAPPARLSMAHRHTWC